MKNKILTILFITFISTFLILNIIIKDQQISYSERRKLTKLPPINITNIINGSIFNKFEDYALDNFIFRDKFRTLKSNINFNILKNKDYNNLYYKDNYIYKIEYPLNENSILKFTNKINKIYNDNLTNMNVYYSIIPDKNYYSNDNYLKLDYDKLTYIVTNNINSNMKYIDITKSLDLSSYYYTDIHWRQEKLTNVINTLSSNMNFKTNNLYNHNEYKPFYGSYYGQLGLKIKPDTIYYLTNDSINNANVNYIDNNFNKVYNEDKLGKMDSYDVFLSGACPIIEITNNNNNNKELIIFRDSFASSLAPLLIEGYHKITLIDLRYINYSSLNDHITFNNQDILFLYNTTIINNSDMLKINL